MSLMIWSTTFLLEFWPTGHWQVIRAEAVLFGEGADRFFIYIDERADNGDAIIAHMDFGEVSGEFGFM